MTYEFIEMIQHSRRLIF